MRFEQSPFAEPVADIPEVKRREMLSILSDTIKPAPLELPAKWCSENRWLSASASPNPIKYSIRQFPFWEEVINHGFPGSPIRRIVVQKSSQIGYSELLCSLIGYLVKHFPVSMQMVMDSAEAAKHFSQQRIQKMFDDNPEIAAMLTKDDTNTILSKSFRNGHLRMIGAAKASHLRGTTARYLFADEVDEWETDLQAQGDPLKLLETRARTFGSRSKYFIGSSPTIDGFSKIQKEYEKTDKRKYHACCIHCGEHFVLLFEYLSFDDGMMYCPHCGSGIRESQKAHILDPANGAKWIPTAKEEQIEYCNESNIRGYHVNALYSPTSIMTWEEVIRQFKEAKNDQSAMKVFVNNTKGEVWKEYSSVPHFRKVMENNVDDYAPKGAAPEDAVKITAGVDIQGDRVEVSCFGWGYQMESWLIDHHVIKRKRDDGRPDMEATYRQDIFDELEEYLLRDFQYGDNPDCRIGIDCVFVDSGFRPDMATYFCQRPSMRHFVFPTKGSTKNDSIYVRPTTKKDALLVNPDYFKTQFYGALDIPKPSEADLEEGRRQKLFCWFPTWMVAMGADGEEYFRQLVSENPVPTGKTRKIVWTKMRERNEALDLRVLCQAAAHYRGLHNLRLARHEQLKLELSTPANIKLEVTMNRKQKKAKRHHSWNNR